MHDWTTAQAHERRYHTEPVEGWPSVAERRAEDARLRRWYAGMLGLATSDVSTAETGGRGTMTVTDIGCGPESLLLDVPDWGAAIALDPLTFTEADESRYVRAGIHRVTAQAEGYAGPPSDEVWLYNCLQHVGDWRRALEAAIRATKGRLRIFEWVNQPTSAVHLHTLRTDELRDVLGQSGMKEAWRVEGQAIKRDHWTQDFYAAVWRRNGDGV